MNLVNKNGIPPPLQQTMAVQLVITMNADGSVNVSGPIANRVLCYGLLQCARDAIRDFVPSPIIPV